MQDAKRPSGGLVVLDVRVSGRLLPFVTMLLLFALLPFLGGTGAPSEDKRSVVLAAGSPAVVSHAADTVASARAALADAEAASGATTGGAFTAAMGGGLFMFPSLNLAPLAAEALVAPVAAEPGFIRPVDGREVSGFGPRIHPVLGVPMFHTGIDLMATCGTPIHAAASGTVVYARVSSSWGLRTIIQHSPRLKTAYGHQSRFLVAEGDHVTQGQVIGLVGTTGWSTGCHLHFDVILDDRYVDPAPYLGLPASSTASVPYGASPPFHLSTGDPVVRPVEDGDVPIPSPTASTGTAPTTTTSVPTTPPTTGSTATSAPTTSTSVPTTPSTTASTGTTTTGTSGTTTTGTPTGATTTTTTAPSDSGTTATTVTTSGSSTTTSPPTEQTTTTAAPPATDATTSTTAAAPTAASTPTAAATQTMATTAAAVMTTATAVATNTSDAPTAPAPQTTSAAEPTPSRTTPSRAPSSAAPSITATSITATSSATSTTTTP